MEAVLEVSVCGLRLMGSPQAHHPYLDNHMHTMSLAPRLAWDLYSFILEYGSGGFIHPIPLPTLSFWNRCPDTWSGSLDCHTHVISRDDCF